ncbi:hypothetical protein CP967_30755 [Streptomyces nitrosporeus]|uniref:Uncharacterized protein n=2 Tax=Streptomyces nitrosporeus TaxID=28894 RepID=A0A5J6FHG9_9ACTN|nr:hypothetical protein CP967_30755 [Streptomyces nitrosporeus]
MLALHLFTLTYLLVLVVPGILFFLWLRRYPDFNRKQAAKRLWLFDDGLIAHARSGDGMAVLRWDSVRLYTDVSQKIVNGVPGPVSYAYTLLSSPKGADTTLTEFYERPGTWGPWIQEAVVRAQGPGALAAVLEGGTVGFGPFDVSLAGLASGGKDRLPWSDLEGIDVQNGRVRVMRTGGAVPWGGSEVKSVANLAVLLAVAESLKGSGPAGHRPSPGRG